jgi:hypothetical protein
VGKLYTFGTLQLSTRSENVVKKIYRLSGMKYIRGVIMGTTGLDNGLDDPTLDFIYAALEKTKTVIFLHPHYGLLVSVSHAHMQKASLPKWPVLGGHPTHNTPKWPPGVHPKYSTGTSKH